MEKSLLKKKEYLVMKRRKLKIPIVSNLPELLDKLKIHLLTIMSCISLDVNVSINRLFWYNLSPIILNLNEFAIKTKVKRK